MYALQMEIEGVCTVGDARYSTLRSSELEQMRLLAVGEDALDRDTVCMNGFITPRDLPSSRPGWFGALDNCLWDIAGKVAGKPVCDLLGRHSIQVEAYYNIRSHDLASQPGGCRHCHPVRIQGGQGSLLSALGTQCRMASVPARPRRARHRSDA